MINTKNILSSNAALRSPADTENQTESSNPKSAVVGFLHAVVKNPNTIETLNREIRNLEQTGESFAGQLDTLREQRDELIKSFTGNSSAESYDVDVVGWAQAKGTTYNHEAMQLNKNRMFQNLHRPFDDQIPYVNTVRELPWESTTVNGRVDTLINTEGLSADAAIVIAMTERPTSPYSFLSVAVSVVSTPDEGGWESNFAQRVTSSGAEIGAWSANQPASATATFGDGGERITVSMRGDQVVVSDGAAEHVFDPEDHDRIVIVGGNGDDSITVDGDVIASLTLVGGAGDDTIIGGNGNNIIIGGDGNDNLEGGASGDLIIGGQGRDSAYGAGGADTISGGADGDALYGGSGEDFIIGEGGDDYIDGGRGNDTLRGGAGSDTISGGFGQDILRGEAGSDTLIGAAGRDQYADAMLGDSIIAERAEVINANGATVSRVEVDLSAGSDAVSIDPASRVRFTDRVEDDLQTLRSLSAGQQMLNALDTEFVRAGHTTVIQEFDQNNGRADWDAGTDIWLQSDGSRSNGESGTISYNPHYNTSANATPKVPIAVLFHEMAHTYDFASGQLLRGNNDNADPADPNFGTRLLELQAAGIAIDHDDNVLTPDQLPNEAGHPIELTENGLRAELGLPSRTVY